MDENKSLEEQINSLYRFLILDGDKAENEGYRPTPWERTFVEDIWKRFNDARSLTGRQVAKVEELYERYFAGI